jgi:hypothetical protein
MNRSMRGFVGHRFGPQSGDGYGLTIKRSKHVEVQGSADVRDESPLARRYARNCRLLREVFIEDLHLKLRKVWLVKIQVVFDVVQSKCFGM